MKNAQFRNHQLLPRLPTLDYLDLYLSLSVSLYLLSTLLRRHYGRRKNEGGRFRPLDVGKEDRTSTASSVPCEPTTELLGTSTPSGQGVLFPTHRETKDGGSGREVDVFVI